MSMLAPQFMAASCASTLSLTMTMSFSLTCRSRISTWAAPTITLPSFTYSSASPYTSSPFIVSIIWEKRVFAIYRELSSFSSIYASAISPTVIIPLILSPLTTGRVVASLSCIISNALFIVIFPETPSTIL